VRPGRHPPAKPYDVWSPSDALTPRGGSHEGRKPWSDVQRNSD
jgi:hypothetical protein